MRKQLFTLLLLLFAYNALGAKSKEIGLPQLQFFTPQDYHGNSQSFNIIQDDRRLIYVANNDGLLEYDGSKWNLIRHPKKYAIESLVKSKSNDIFIGCEGDIAYLDSDQFGNQIIVSLNEFVPDEHRDFGDVWVTLEFKGKILFQANRKIFRWSPLPDNPGKGKMEVFTFDDNESIEALTDVNGHLVLNSSTRGCVELKNDKFVELPGLSSFSRKYLWTIVPFDDKRWLLSAGADGLFLYDGKNISPFHGSANDLAKIYEAHECIRLPNNHFALGTGGAGLVIFDRQGEIIQIIDKYSGLPDNKVDGFPYLDHDGNIWIPLEYGLAYLNISVQKFNYQLGFQGGAGKIIRYKNTIFIGSSRGLFRLDASDKKGALAHFTKIEKTVGCWDLVLAHDKLYCVDDKGLFYLNHDLYSITRVGTQKDLISIDVSPDGEYLFAGSYYEGLFAFKYHKRKKNFIFQKHIETDWPRVQLIHIDNRNNIWTWAESRINFGHVERFSDLDKGLENLKHVIYDTSQSIPTALPTFFDVENITYLATEKGLFKFDENLNKFNPSNLLGNTFAAPGRKIISPYVDEKNKIWFGDSTYRKYCAQMDDSNIYQISRPLNLYLIYDIEYFYVNYSDSTYWLSGTDGTIVRSDISHCNLTPVPLQTLIRKVKIGADSLIYNGGENKQVEHILPYSKNIIRIDYSLPSFTNNETNIFRHRLIGQNEEWSQWSHEKYNVFTNLKEGKYTFEVQGVDINENEGKTDKFSFIIQPPIYRTTLAYAFYSFLSILAVFLASKIRYKSINLHRSRLAVEIRERTSELEEANEKINNLYKELEEKNEELALQLQTRTKKLVESERQAVFGQMVQGIVHNLRNPLTIVSGNAQLIRTVVKMAKSKSEADLAQKQVVFENTLSNVEKRIELIESSATTLNNMITSLMTKSRTDKSDNREIIDLNTLIKNELEFYEADAMFKHKTQRHVDLFKRKLPVWVVPGELAQVFGNLVRNALDAMFNMDDPTLWVQTEVDNDMAVMIVADNGPGIPEDIRDRVFEPFFTTKERANTDTDVSNNSPKGTGLGLWMCREAIESFGGTINVNSVAGKGTTFAIALPLHSDDELKTDDEVHIKL